MKIIVLLIVLLAGSPLPHKSGDKSCCRDSKTTSSRCTGSKYCSACRNCSRCAHCSGGGYCGVCRPDLFEEPREKPKITVIEKTEKTEEDLLNIQSSDTITNVKAHKTKTKHRHTPISSKKTPISSTPTNTFSTPVYNFDDDLEAQNKKARGIIALVCIVLIILTIPIISSLVRKRKKERMEEDILQAEIEAKKELKRLIDQAFHAQKLNQDQYNDLQRIYSSSSSAFIKQRFDIEKKFKSRVDYLSSKYNKTDVQRILNHEYWIGMTEEQLIDCKGKPTKIELEQLKTKAKKIFIYGNKSSGDVFNFVDGVLERFKDR